MSLSVDIAKHFDDFSLEVALDAGAETLGFLGASGCGKSLTLRCIAGIETPDEGKIIVNDTVFFDKAHGKKARVNLAPQQRKTALLFQNYQLFPNLTVEQNVAAGLNPKMESTTRSTLINEQLIRFGLENLAKRYPLQLSGGQQQRVALARMLAAKPGILMLDEPFSALDAHLKSALEQDLQKLFERFEGSILYVSHDIDEAFRFCDRIAVVSEGHLEEIDTKDRIITDPQTLATIRLSGCKNTTEAIYVDEHHAFLPKWNITITSEKPLSPEIKYCGMRAKFIEYADDAASLNPDEASIEKTTELSENTYWVRVEHVSDSRFERTVLITFLHGKELETIQKNETSYTEASNNTELNNDGLFDSHETRTGSLDLTDETEATPIQWHINKLTATRLLPEAGDLCKVTLNPRGLYFVNR
ncbi:aBC-type sulfate/molybdate transport systems ATPase component [Eggerthella sp. CAG:1427]|nr:aBC-type sulfate/molybdate transport systems ATPase component [Eggerthella sp. CAG:1427]